MCTAIFLTLMDRIDTRLGLIAQGMLSSFCGGLESICIKRIGGAGWVQAGSFNLNLAAMICAVNI